MATAEVQIKSKMTISTDGVEQKAKQQGKKAASAASKEMEKVGGGLNKGMQSALRDTSRGLKALGNEFSRTFGGMANIVGLGKGGIILTAAFAAIQAVQGLWDKLTLTPEEKISKNQSLISQSQVNIKQIEDRYNQAKNYIQSIKQLNELNKDGNWNNFMKTALSVENVLSNLFGEKIVFQIDEVNKRITNLDAIMQKFAKRERIQKLDEMARQFHLLSQSTSVFANQFADLSDTLGNKALRLLASNVLTMGLPHSGIINALFDKLDKKNTAKMFNEASLQEKRDILISKINGSTTTREIQGYKKILDMVNRTIALRDEAVKLDAVDLTLHKAISDELNKQKSIRENNKKLNRDRLYSSLTNSSDRIDFLQNQINQNMPQISALQALNDAVDIQNVKEDLDRLIGRRNELTEKYSSAKTFDEKKSLISELIEINALIKSAENELLNYQKNQTKINELLEKQDNLRAQIAEIRRKDAQYFDKNIQSLNDEIAVQKLILQGKYEEAEKQRLINKLKQQGIQYDEQTLNKQLNAQKELSKTKINETLKDQIQALQLKLNPNDVDLQAKMRIRSLQRQNGKELDPKQKKIVQELVRIENGLNNRLKSNFEVKTNELTSRGGFNKGVFVNRDEYYEKQIADNTNKTNSLLTMLNNLTKQAGEI